MKKARDGDRKMTEKCTRIETEHYIIRDVCFSDYESFAVWEVDPDMTRYFALDKDRTYEDVVTEEYKEDGNVFKFYLDMTDGEPNSAYLKFYDRLANYSGVSHTSFELNRVA